MKYYKNITSHINKETLNWYYKRESSSLYPPIIGKFAGKLYQLNNFDYQNSDGFIKEFEDFESLIDFSFKIHSDINLIEIANGLKIADEMGCNLNKLQFIKDAGIKGEKNRTALINILDADDLLKDYIVQKKLTVKYINLFLKLKPNLQKIAIDFLRQKTPSVGEFRKLLNFLYDYSRLITVDTYDENLINRVKEAKNPILYDIKNEIEDIQNKLGKKIKFIPLTNFETCDFKIEIHFSNETELETEIKKINKDTLTPLFNKLKSYDIC